MIGSRFWVRSLRRGFRRAILHVQQRPWALALDTRFAEDPTEIYLPSHLKTACSMEGANLHVINGSCLASSRQPPLPAATTAFQRCRPEPLASLSPATGTAAVVPLPGTLGTPALLSICGRQEQDKSNTAPQHQDQVFTNITAEIFQE